MFARERSSLDSLRERLFNKGDLKYVVLDLLKDKPRHGYEIINALRERLGGLYTPSSGTIYPTLRLLEERGYVQATQRLGKTVYAVVEEGRRFLTEQEHVVENIWTRASTWGGPALRGELQGLRYEVQNLARLFGRVTAAAPVDLDKLRRIRAVVARAGQEIEAILSEPRPSADPPSS